MNTFNGFLLMQFFIVPMLLLLALPTSAQPLWTTQWGRHNPDTLDNLIWDIDCADSTNCFAVGAYGPSIESYVLRTTDGGISWNKVQRDTTDMHTLPAPVWYKSLAAPTARTVIVVADSGVILRTSDSGQHWTRQRITKDSSRQLSRISMADEQHGVVAVVATLRNYLMKTSDGGVTWDSVGNNTVGGYIEDVACPTPTTFICWVITGGHDMITRTSDGGANWQTFRNAPVDTNESEGHLCFIDSLRGWAASRIWIGGGWSPRAVISHTTDGGQSWTIQFDQKVSRGLLTDVSFYDAENGLVTGEFGLVFRTSDGGVTWDQETTDQSENISNCYVSYKRRSKGIITTAWGQILRYTGGVGTVVQSTTVAAENVVVPNPVVQGARVRVSFQLGERGRVRVSLSNALGEEVAAMPEQEMEAGSHSEVLEASALASGAYFVRLEIGGRSYVRVVQIVR